MLPRRVESLVQALSLPKTVKITSDESEMRSSILLREWIPVPHARMLMLAKN